MPIPSYALCPSNNFKAALEEPPTPFDFGAAATSRPVDPSGLAWPRRGWRSGRSSRPPNSDRGREPLRTVREPRAGRHQCWAPCEQRCGDARVVAQPRSAGRSPSIVVRSNRGGVSDSARREGRSACGAVPVLRAATGCPLERTRASRHRFPHRAWTATTLAARRVTNPMRS